LLLPVGWKERDVVFAFLWGGVIDPGEHVEELTCTCDSCSSNWCLVLFSFVRMDKEAVDHFNGHAEGLLGY
jgi:hypothetical protein